MTAFAKKSGHEGEAATDDADAEFYETVEMTGELAGLLLGCNSLEIGIGGE